MPHTELFKICITYLLSTIVFVDRLATKGKDQWIRGQIKNLSIEGGSGIVVVDPLDVTGEYTCVQDKTSMIIGTTDISMRLSFNVISLVLRFHQDAVSTFRFRDAYPVLPCTHFDRIWVTNTGLESVLPILSNCIYRK